MREKMARFLSSIGIRDIERFDLDFDMVQRDPNDHDTVLMEVRKDDPWSYELLCEFQDALLSVTDYKADIHFNYVNKPSAFDATNLFHPWYFKVYRTPENFVVAAKDKDTIGFTFKDEETMAKAKGRIDEFGSFLRFIGYEFNLVTEVEKPMDSPISEPIERDSSDSEMTQAEGILLKRLEENEKIMLEERNRERVYSRGNYKPVDKIERIDKLGMCSVDFVGEIFEPEVRVTKSGKSMLSCGFGDETGAIGGRAFENAKTLTAERMAKLTAGMRVRVRGAVDLDKYTNQKVIVVHYIDELPFRFERDDDEPIKRVELHLHSKMSVMDGICDMNEYVKYAKHFGMKAIALTDHGVVQAFPELQGAVKGTDIKPIYGSELYMFDLHPTYIFNPCDTELEKATYCVFDFETTGLSTKRDRITEFGAVIFKNGLVSKKIDFFINPERPIPKAVQEKTHITDEMVATADKIDVAMQKMMDFIGDSILVSHNATFDVGFLNAARERLGMEPIKNPVIDTLALSHYLFPKAAAHRLGNLSRNLGLSTYNEDEAHRADFDAEALSAVWREILGIFRKGNEHMRHCDLADLKCEDPDIFKHLRAYHCNVIAKNKEGLKDLYKLISESHITYLADVPKTPRELIEKYREHFFVGSACFNSEVFEIARTRSKAELLETMKFYDYIELQPLENYSWLVNTNSVTQDQLMDILKDIVECADELGKPIVATGDVHYCEPTQRIYRDVYISALGIGNSRHPLNPRYRDRLPYFENPDQYFRTTREMLDAFAWMGEEKAYEVVVTNTNRIADAIEPLVPVSDDLFKPDQNLPHSDEKIRELCYGNLKKKYGDNPDPQVKARLDRELEGIVGNGYAVTYYIAHKIIHKANEDGYIVGSRGSVGSSFAATMADITEVNPLAPHYFCPHCKHFEWVDKSLGFRSGFDLPLKNCPVCGEPMERQGQDIPFETFLGFSGEKVPDIDLNFPPDYQSRAHDYTRVLLGAGNVFRAGTISTVAQKTAFGYVRKYFEEYFRRNGKNDVEAKELVDAIPNNRIAYMATHCEGVKRTTGQHPGGIVVVPQEYEVYDFTAIQHPADDPDANWLTTHFDFRSMHDELLKLDLLGHVDPMAMREMSIYTGIDIHTIPMDDPLVLGLFSSAESLGLKENHTNIDIGTLGLPEFGTATAIRMLRVARPKSFNDLLIISGLAHGTDVWANNAEDLITSGTATLQEVIGCRDDIMLYLISKGVDSALSFKIMEAVRKGKKLKEDQAKIMLEHGVPQYYVDSCNKIAYLFPRAHATAYVMMAVRVAYFKVYYPLDFYAVFFSVRCDAWDVKAMCAGKEAIFQRYDELKAREKSRIDPLSNKEKSILDTLELAVEMVERGYAFGKMDLYKSHPTMWTVDKENKCIIPPFSCVDNLGESAARSVEIARKDGKFLSKEDLARRTKLSSTNIKDLDELGALDGLGETNQMSLFEFI